MRSGILILVFLSLTGCVVQAQPRVLTDNQKKYFETMSLAERSYMDSCLIVHGSYQLEFHDCQRKMAEDLGAVAKPVQQSSGTSITKTAVGTAIGYGAAKLILGH